MPSPPAEQRVWPLQSLQYPPQLSQPQLPPPQPSLADSAGDKIKRARTSRPKVKTGCTNCKQRRIKCDENRPSCTQCLRAKKQCSGYPPPARSTRPFEVRIAPKPVSVLMAAPPVGSSTGLSSGPSSGPASRAISPLPQPQLQAQIAPRRLQKVQRRKLAAAVAIVKSTVPVFTYSPSLTLPFNHQEGLYFQLFRLHTANELSGFFDDVFWSCTVLVECHSAAAIRHAVVALGALYKTLEASTASPPNSPGASGARPSADCATSHWEVALKQYSSACCALATMNPDDPHIQRTRLMASVLLACFDSFIGDHKQAIVQIQTGLLLLDRLRSNSRRTVTEASNQDHPSVSEPVEDELLQMFTRLAIQAKSYDMAFHFPQPYVIRLLPAGASAASVLADIPSSSSSPSSPADSSDVNSGGLTLQTTIPERFSSLREARLAWDTLCERMLRFTEGLFQHASGPPNILPTSMRQYGQYFQACLVAWDKAFEPLLVGRTLPCVSSQEKAGIAVLKMFQIMSQILFLMTFSDSEMRFDNYQPQFATIVRLAFEIVGDEEQRAAAARCPDPTQCAHTHGPHRHYHNSQNPYKTSHLKASFSADLGIVPPLYVVATKSRDRLLRRQAIQLLQSSARRESMWDSELMARISTWVMEIEEEGDDDPFGGQEQLLTPGASPGPSVAFPQRQSAADLDRAPHGSGGNAGWGARRGNIASVVRPVGLQPIPAEKRILVKACEFDLRGHTALLKCGTRGLVAGTVDHRTRMTKIRW